MNIINFSIEQLMRVPNYKTICDCYFSLAPNDEIRNVLMMILYEGRYNNQFLCTSECRVDSPLIEASRRLSVAHLLITYPETFKLLFDNKISFFHGTNGNSLPSILKYGLCSENKLINEGISVNTGEYISRTSNHRNLVSFTDSCEIAHEYSGLSPKNAYSNDLSFEVIIGTTTQEILSSGKIGALSDLPEVGIKDNFSKNSIKVILVPYDKVQFVKKLLNDDNILVAPMYKYTDKFWQSITGYLSYSPDLYIKFKDNNYSNNKMFSANNMKQLAENRMLCGIKKITDRFRNIFIKEGEQYGRTK